MDHLPVFLDVKGRVVLIVGGGTVAARKLTLLRAAGAQVRLVAPRVDVPAQEGLEIVHEPFAARHLDGVSFVIAATDSAEVNAGVARLASQRGLWVNVVDDAETSTAIVPAIVDRAPLTVAIGTSGASPVLARHVRALIEAAVPERIGALAALAGRARARVAAALPSAPARRSFWERFLRGAAAERVLAGQDPDPDATLAGELARAASTRSAGIVYLIGAGPGDPELLTLRAARLLAEADVVLYDRLVSPAVLARARRDAGRVFVGKESGRHFATQDEINAQLIAFAKQGLRVARLKGGDPFIFGRGGEELEALRAEGIDVVVVPGITAGFGAAAQFGLPLTFRDIAERVTFVTAAGEGAGALDWRALAGPRQTIVFYMVVAQLEAIAGHLIAAGAPPSRPAVVVERATLPDERLTRGTLATIAALARGAEVRAPALLIVGEAVERGRAAAGGEFGAADTALLDVA